MIRISKDAITFSYLEVDADGNRIERTVDVLSTTMGLVSYLTVPCNIDEGVTVFDILKHLMGNVEATDYVFDSALGGHSFKDYIEEMQQDMPNSANIKRLEICHEVDEVNEDLILYSTARLRGIGHNGALFSVEFSPIPTYMNLDVSLNKTYRLRITSSEHDEEEDEEGENIDATIIELQKEFSLQDVIHSILYEMSYYGTPDMRQKALEEVLEHDLVEEIEVEEEPDELERLQEDLMKHIETEDYEAAARLRDRIRQFKEKGTNGDGLDISKK